MVGGYEDERQDHHHAELLVLGASGDQHIRQDVAAAEDAEDHDEVGLLETGEHCLEADEHQ